MTRGGRVALGVAAGAAALAIALVPDSPAPYVPPAVADPGGSFDGYVARLQARSAAEGVPESHRERLVRRAEGRTRVAFVYLHGFGASRPEGEAVVDPLAEAYGANVYYHRLPGHGGGGDAHARVVSTDYLSSVDEAVGRARTLGERVVLIGSSTGGLLAAWAAAQRPQDVDALVLASPLFGFRSRLAFLGGSRLGRQIVEVTQGAERDASFSDDPEGRKQPGYDDHWITRQRWPAFYALYELWRRAATPDVWSRVKAPVLLLYTESDAVIDVDAVKRAYGTFAPHAKSRLTPIADGNHILMSQYVRTDKAAITRALRDLVDDVLR